MKESLMQDYFDEPEKLSDLMDNAPAAADDDGDEEDIFDESPKPVPKPLIKTLDNYDQDI